MMMHNTNKYKALLSGARFRMMRGSRAGGAVFVKLSATHYQSEVSQRVYDLQEMGDGSADGDFLVCVDPGERLPLASEGATGARVRDADAEVATLAECYRQIAAREREHDEFLASFAEAFTRADAANRRVMLECARTIAAKYRLVENMTRAEPTKVGVNSFDHASVRDAGRYDHNNSPYREH
jgi:hypothetical protein